MAEQTSEDRSDKLLRDIRRELRESRLVQESIARNFNAVVIMVIFAVLLGLVSLFLGDQIQQGMAKYFKPSVENKVARPLVDRN